MSLIEHLLFEESWPLVGALGVTAVMLALMARRRAQPRLLLWALGAVVLAGAVYTTARLVTTPREQILQRTQELVRVTAPLNLDRVGEVLDARVQLVGPEGELWLDREQILAALAAVHQRWQVAAQEVLRVDAEAPSRAVGRSVLDVRTTLRGELDVPMTTQWVLTWQRGAGGPWRAVRIQWTLMQGQKPTEGMWR